MAGYRKALSGEVTFALRQTCAVLSASDEVRKCNSKSLDHRWLKYSISGCRVNLERVIDEYISKSCINRPYAYP